MEANYQMIIEVTNVCKSFKKQKVLKDITLGIDQKEIFGLLGPSGAGKTTLIRVITGAINSDSGTVRVDGLLIPNMESLEIIGFMPQSDALYDDISGVDNLKFFGKLYGLKGIRLKERVEEVLELVDLTGDAKKHVMFYSGGMKKRLSLGISLIHQPKVLILDEPTVGIDPLLRRKVWDEFARLKELGTTIVVTTHVMDEAMKCDRVGLIYDGELIACDLVEKLLEQTPNHSLEDLFFQTKEVSI